MARNFGIWNAAQSVELDQLSDRTAHGEVTPSGPHFAPGAQRKSNIYFFQPARALPPDAGPNSRGDESPEPFIRDRAFNVGAWALVVGLALLPAMFLWSVVFFLFALFDFG